ncbi:YHYH domain-containing protein [Cytobacillus pseudoceanisediminis]|uniref:YHYH domain-containing protein n=1 Tax=Bacillaceae TaxID=186817 RepID=UPI001A8E62D5|nr:YHYH domain-containing protein [Bacillus sp. NTK034]MBN8199189.1 YHYH domain-containing protein [Bacillus sp. NTK034]
MRVLLFYCTLLVLIFPLEAYAHSGRTDSYGGHNKTANGTYHCHSGKCLEDAWEEALKIAYPSGQEDGRIGENQYKEYEEVLHKRVLNEEIDSDQAEYMIPYLLKAYKQGYEDTYIPSFWEKYKLHLGLMGISLLIIPSFIYKVYKGRKGTSV